MVINPFRTAEKRQFRCVASLREASQKGLAAAKQLNLLSEKMI